MLGKVERMERRTADRDREGEEERRLLKRGNSATTEYQTLLWDRGIDSGLGSFRPLDSNRMELQRQIKKYGVKCYVSQFLYAASGMQVSSPSWSPG